LLNSFSSIAKDLLTSTVMGFVEALLSLSVDQL
jgi:hypothetical protein